MPNHPSWHLPLLTAYCTPPRVRFNLHAGAVAFEHPLAPLPAAAASAGVSLCGIHLPQCCTTPRGRGITAPAASRGVSKCDPRTPLLPNTFFWRAHKHACGHRYNRPSEHDPGQPKLQSARCDAPGQRQPSGRAAHSGVQNERALHEHAVLARIFSLCS